MGANTHCKSRSSSVDNNQIIHLAVTLTVCHTDLLSVLVRFTFHLTQLWLLISAEMVVTFHLTQLRLLLSAEMVFTFHLTQLWLLLSAEMVWSHRHCRKVHSCLQSQSSDV